MCIFGDIVDGAICLNDTGRIVAEVWQWLATQYDYVMSDAWVIMPNHLHGIMVITHPSGDADQARGGSRTAPTRRKSVGRLVGHSKRCPPNASTNSAVRRARWSGSAIIMNISSVVRRRWRGFVNTSLIHRAGLWIGRIAVTKHRYHVRFA